MTLVSIPLMDRTGRRTLHLYGLGGMFIFSIFITISFLIKASILFSFLPTTSNTSVSTHIDTHTHQLLLVVVPQRDGEPGKMGENIPTNIAIATTTDKSMSLCLVVVKDF